MLHASGGRQKALCRVSVLSATIYHIKVVSEHKLSSLFIHLMQAIRWGREGDERGGKAAKAAARWAWRLPYCLHRAPERAGLFCVVFSLAILVGCSYSRAPGWGWQGTLWGGGSVHHALHTVAEVPTSSSTSRIWKHQPLLSAVLYESFYPSPEILCISFFYFPYAKALLKSMRVCNLKIVAAIHLCL